MERISSIEFSEIVADYGLEPWGDEWKQTAFLASSMAVTESGKPIKDYKSIIPRRFNYTFIVDTTQVDDEKVFRGLTGGNSSR